MGASSSTPSKTAASPSSSLNSTSLNESLSLSSSTSSSLSSSSPSSSSSFSSPVTQTQHTSKSSRGFFGGSEKKRFETALQELDDSIRIYNSMYKHRQTYFQVAAGRMSKGDPAWADGDRTLRATISFPASKGLNGVLPSYYQSLPVQLHEYWTATEVLEHAKVFTEIQEQTSCQTSCWTKTMPLGFVSMIGLKWTTGKIFRTIPLASWGSSLVASGFICVAGYKYWDEKCREDFFKKQPAEIYPLSAFARHILRRYVPTHAYLKDQPVNEKISPVFEPFTQMADKTDSQFKS